MNTEQFKQSWEQLGGPLQKHWGKFTDNDLLQIGGDLAKFNGATEQRYAGSTDDVRRWTDLWYARWIGSYIQYYAEWKPAVGSRF